LDSERRQQSGGGDGLVEAMGNRESLGEESTLVLAGGDGVPERRKRRRIRLSSGCVPRPEASRERIERPPGRRLGPDHKGSLARPQDHRRPTIPAVKRVAVIAHIALVL